MISRAPDITLNPPPVPKKKLIVQNIPLKVWGQMGENELCDEERPWWEGTKGAGAPPPPLLVFFIRQGWN